MAAKVAESKALDQSDKSAWKGGGLTFKNCDEMVENEHRLGGGLDACGIQIEWGVFARPNETQGVTGPQRRSL